MNAIRISASRSIKIRLMLLVLGVLPATLAGGILIPSYFAERSMRSLAEERLRSTGDGLAGSLVLFFALFVVAGTIWMVVSRTMRPIERLIAADATAEMQRLDAEAAQREFLGVFERLMKDRNGFIEFFNEAAGLVDGFATGASKDRAAVLRHVHTLKGNSAVFGVQSISEVCHKVETAVAEEGATVLDQGLKEIQEAWSRFTARVVPLIGTETSEIVEVAYQDLDAILNAVRRGESSARVLSLLERLTREPIEVRFRRSAEQARGLAMRLGRSNPIIDISPNGVRLPRHGWAPFWAAFVHLVRNCLDHGIESAAEREANGKSPSGTIELSAAEIAGHVVITIKDDGRGVDWEKVRANAARIGLPTASRDDLENALFEEGFTTRDEASATSGGGVGMRAVKDACESMGGTIDLDSELGQGTTVTVTIPFVATQGSVIATLRPATRESLHLRRSAWP